MEKRYREELEDVGRRNEEGGRGRGLEVGSGKWGRGREKDKGERVREWGRATFEVKVWVRKRKGLLMSTYESELRGREE